MYVKVNEDKHKAVITPGGGYSSALRTEEEYREARKETLEKRQEELRGELTSIDRELSLIERGVTPPSFYTV